MKKLLLASTILAVTAAPALAADIKVGVILGFTGPIESLTPDMAASAELAFKEASDSGLLLDGSKIVSVRADSTCVDSAAATAAAEKLITSDNVAAIMGADCSGVTGAIANNVAVPNGVVMISPSATSPGLSALKDKGYFFRTSPSDARQGEVLASILKSRSIMEVAVTFTNNDYGKGLAESFTNAFKAVGGKVSITAAHEDGKADYSAEVGALSAGGSKHLAVFGYLDQGGKGIIQASLDSGGFEKFILADGMIGDSLTKAIGSDLNGAIGTLPGSESEGATSFLTMAGKAGIKQGGPFTAESYDAGALLALAMQAAGSADRAAIQSKLMMVGNAPGEKIMPGEIAKGLKILKAGGDIDYVGATNVEFNKIGEVLGTYKELEVTMGEFKTVKVH
jgi:branched-chain amino acid transport system substrate-binding protein